MTNFLQSQVDAAHGIGTIEMDLGAADPDFLVTNCHKWLYAPRGTALFYVAPRNRHLTISSLPTSHSYIRRSAIKLPSDAEATDGKDTWLDQWEAPGTFDFAHFPAVNAALDFREQLGGESRIREYTHGLARAGGAAAANILGTEVLDTDEWELTTTMVNVRLPLLHGTWKSETWFAKDNLNDVVQETLLRQFKTTIKLFE